MSNVSAFWVGRPKLPTRKGLQYDFAVVVFDGGGGREGREHGCLQVPKRTEWA